jgi:hypothetical protein
MQGLKRVEGMFLSNKRTLGVRFEYSMSNKKEHRLNICIRKALGCRRRSWASYNERLSPEGGAGIEKARKGDGT